MGKKQALTIRVVNYLSIIHSTRLKMWFKRILSKTFNQFNLMGNPIIYHAIPKIIIHKTVIPKIIIPKIIIHKICLVFRFNKLMAKLTKIKAHSLLKIHQLFNKIWFLMEIAIQAFKQAKLILLKCSNPSNLYITSIKSI